MALAEAPEPVLGAAIRVEVVYCPRPGVTDCCTLELPPGTLLAEAVRRSGLLQRHGLSLEDVPIGIWGRVRGADAALRDRDRVELYRALQVDPKEARRLRYRSAKQKRQDQAASGSG